MNEMAVISDLDAKICTSFFFRLFYTPRFNSRKLMFSIRLSNRIIWLLFVLLSIHVDGDTDLAKSYEIERIITKRLTKRRGTEYLVRWRGFEPEEDSWRNRTELGNASEV